jgi:hypothetical protein
VLAPGDINATPTEQGTLRGWLFHESYQRRKGVPSPKGYHEAKPREKKDAAVNVNGVKQWNGPGFAAGRVHVWGGVQVGELETHGA